MIYHDDQIVRGNPPREGLVRRDEWIGRARVGWLLWSATGCICRRQPAIRHRERGQSLVLMVLVLPVLMLLVFAMLELGLRRAERNSAEDALQMATRSTAQLFDYEALARNEISLRGSACPTAITLAQAEAQQAGCLAILRRAVPIVEANLQRTLGLDGREAAIARRNVVWQVFPDGGTCTFPGNYQPINGGTRPTICAAMSGVEFDEIGVLQFLGAEPFAPIVAAGDVLATE